jgi:hypothetical protein
VTTGAEELLDASRFRLPGRYRTPRVRYGQTVRCLLRGEVEVVGLTDAPIPWPLGKRGRHKPSSSSRTW